METVIPPVLCAVRELRFHMRSGHAMNEAFRLYLADCGDELANELRERWTLRLNSGAAPPVAFKTHFRRALWELIERGSAGHPVLEALEGLEHEIEIAAEAELERHISSLPFKALLPLLFCQFPAHLLLLLGPMLRELNRHLGG